MFDFRFMDPIISEGYTCLTAHYVNENWELKNIILNFCHMPPPHTGTHLLEKILSFLEEWGIEKKIFPITLDNTLRMIIAKIS